MAGVLNRQRISNMGYRNLDETPPIPAYTGRATISIQTRRNKDRMFCDDLLAGAIRVILFGLNFSTLLAGGVLMGCGIYLKVSAEEFADLDNAEVLDIVANFLLAMGCMVVLVSLFGCLGACLQNHVLLSIYFVLMLVLLLAEVAIGILYALEKTSMGEKIDDAVKSTVENYGDGTTSADIAIDTIQTYLHCCGYNDLRDYKLDEILVHLPKSCCDPDNIIAQVGICNAADAYKTGCKEAIDNALEAQSVLVIIVVCSVGVFEIITMLAACYLRRRELENISMQPYDM